MKNRDEIKLDVISNIDSEMIDEVTAKRVKYSISPRKPFNLKSKPFYAIAASVLLLLSSVITVFVFLMGTPPVDTKQIPIYKGMTVSVVPPDIGTEVDDEALHSGGGVILDSSGRGLSDIDRTWRKSRGVYGRNKDLIDGVFLDNEASQVSFDIDKANQELVESLAPNDDMYYAKPNEFIYITVHVENPDAFEILSFTLNGMKYSSYMFEEGSDLENLVLKVNVGDAKGIISYTIDAIKYVDGKEIKDVKMDGERTVLVGVYAEEQPNAVITNLKYRLDSISFNASIEDNAGAVALSGGKLFAVLYRDGKIFRKQELSLGDNDIEFSLDEQGEYSYAVVAVFDAFDGEGYSAHVLSSGSFSNETMLDIEFLGMKSGQKIAYSLQTYNQLLEISRIQVVRLSDGKVLGEVEGAGDGILSLDEKDDFGKVYLKVLCYYASDGIVRSCDFYSEEFSIPAVPVIGEVGRIYCSVNPYYDENIGEWRLHQGVDYIPTTSDLSVLSCTDGTVSNIRTNTGYGVMVEIVDQSGCTYIYGLLDESLEVEVGDTVKMGDLIGTIGTYPNKIEGGDGPHLHLQFKGPDGNLALPPLPIPADKKLECELETASLRTYHIREDDKGIPILLEFYIKDTGAVYTDVALEYSSDYEYMTVGDGVIEFDLTKLSDGVTSVTVTITASVDGVTSFVEKVIPIPIPEKDLK